MNSSKPFDTCSVFYIKCPQFTPLRKVGKDCPAGTLVLLVGLVLLTMVSDTLINHLHSWFMTRGEKALLPPTWGIFDNQNIEIEIMCKKQPRNYELPCMVYGIYVSNDKFILK